MSNTKRTSVPHAPGLIVYDKSGNGSCASMVTTSSKDGRWGLSFLVSGEIRFLPWEEVDRIHYYPASPHGRTHCDVCDGQLTAWPEGETETGAVEHFDREPSFMSSPTDSPERIRRTTVFLNGEKVNFCVGYNTVVGWVDRYVEAPEARDEPFDPKRYYYGTFNGQSVVLRRNQSGHRLVERVIGVVTLTVDS